MAAISDTGRLGCPGRPAAERGPGTHSNPKSDGNSQGTSTGATRDHGHTRAGDRDCPRRWHIRHYWRWWHAHTNSSGHSPTDSRFRPGVYAGHPRDQSSRDANYRTRNHSNCNAGSW